jgi:hypothetical protein
MGDRTWHEQQRAGLAPCTTSSLMRLYTVQVTAVCTAHCTADRSSCRRRLPLPWSNGGTDSWRILGATAEQRRALECHFRRLHPPRPTDVKQTDLIVDQKGRRRKVTLRIAPSMHTPRTVPSQRKAVHQASGRKCGTPHGVNSCYLNGHCSPVAVFLRMPSSKTCPRLLDRPSAPVRPASVPAAAAPYEAQTQCPRLHPSPTGGDLAVRQLGRRQWRSRRKAVCSMRCLLREQRWLLVCAQPVVTHHLVRSWLRLEVEVSKVSKGVGRDVRCMAWRYGRHMYTVRTRATIKHSIMQLRRTCTCVQS